MVQLSHLHMTAGKSVAWTTRIFGSKVMSLLFNMLSRFVIAFLPRSKQASFNFMAAVTVFSDLGTQENLSLLPLPPFYLPWVIGPDAEAEAPILWHLMPSNHLVLCRPLLLLPSIFPSIRVFSNKLALHIRWPKAWSFTTKIQSFRLIFKTDAL